jgi:hypothetical protein
MDEYVEAILIGDPWNSDDSATVSHRRRRDGSCGSLAFVFDALRSSIFLSFRYGLRFLLSAASSLHRI